MSINPQAGDTVSQAGMSSSIPLTQPDDESNVTTQTPSVKTKPGMSNRKKLWLIIGAIVALIVIVGLVLYFTLRTPASSGPTTRTQDFTVATTTMETTVSASGTIEPAQRSDLTFTSAGTVTAVNVAVGDKVTAGEALAAIDTTDLQTAVTQAQSAVDAAQSDYNTAVSSGTSAQQTAAESTLTTKQNALANAQTALANGTLTAPFDGTVAIVNVAVGDKVGSGSGGSGSSGASNPNNITNGANSGNSSSSASITIITTDTYQVTTSVSSADVSNVQKGQACTVTPSSTSTQMKGTVDSVGVIATSSTSSGATFPVVIDVTGTQQGLYAGVSATISIVTSSRSVLAVPTSAITRQGANEYVQLKTDSGTAQTAVQTGSTSGGMTEVTSGVKAGDVVVITITVAGSGNSTSGPGAFASMFGGGGNRQRPSGAASGNFQYPGGGGGMPTDFPAGGGQAMQPGSGPTQ